MAGPGPRPQTGTRSVGASGAVDRGDHATAILTRNGAPLLAGGGAPGPVNDQNADAPSWRASAGGTNQSWKPNPQGGGHALVSAYDNLCISVYAAAMPAGSGIVGWTCNGAADRTFDATGAKL